MDQVKACSLAAQQGEEWQPDAPLDGSTNGSENAAASSEDGSGQGGSSGDTAAAGTPTPAAAAAAAADGRGAAKRPVSSSPSGRMTLFGALLAWVGIVGMFLSILPRLYHRVKRRSSHADPAAKLSV